MKSLSLKMDDAIFGDTEKILSQTGKRRNRYINEAVDYYNKMQLRNLLEDQFKYESELLRENSLEILDEFEALEDEN
jgi:hypothetical protein